MENYLILLRGPTPRSATMIAATANPRIVREFADQVLASSDDVLTDPGTTGDAVEKAVASGRREALEMVRRESEDDEESA